VNTEVRKALGWDKKMGPTGNKVMCKHLNLFEFLGGLLGLHLLGPPRFAPWDWLGKEGVFYPRFFRFYPSGRPSGRARFHLHNNVFVVIRDNEAVVSVVVIVLFVFIYDTQADSEPRDTRGLCLRRQSPLHAGTVTQDDAPESGPSASKSRNSVTCRGVCLKRAINIRHKNKPFATMELSRRATINAINVE